MKWIGTQTVYNEVRFRSVVKIINTKTSSATEGGRLTLISDDGAAMGDDHRLGAITFRGAEDAIGTLKTGAKIQAFADAAWSASENGTRLEFYTMDGNASSELSLTLDSNLLATFVGGITVGGTLTVDSVGVSAIQTSSESFVDNDTSLMTSAAVADKIEAYGYSTTTGDITGVVLTADDSNTVSDTGGSADFTIQGNNGITTAIDTHMTISAANASTSAKGVVELATTAETTTGTDTGRAVTPDGLKDGYQGSSNVTTLGTIGTGVWQGTAIASAYLDADTAHYSAQRQFTYHGYTDDQGTTKQYIGLLDADSEATATTNGDLPFVAPFAGKLLKVFLRSNKNLTGHTLTWRLETQATGVSFGTGPTIVGTQSGAGSSTTAMTTYDFTSSLDSGDNVIDANDMVYLSMQSNTDFGSNVKHYITCLWEWDLS
mgnify:FL=1